MSLKYTTEMVPQWQIPEAEKKRKVIGSQGFLHWRSYIVSSTRAFVVTVKKSCEDLTLHQMQAKPSTNYIYTKRTNHKISEERPVIGDWPKEACLEPETTEAINGDLLLWTFRFY